MRWFYAGPIECPNCHVPISDEAMVCPYCHSTAPLSAPWQQMRWQMTGLVLCFLAGMWLCDQLCGTQTLTILWSWLTKRGAH